MKQYKYLYSKMLNEKIIRKAYKNLRKGKTKRVEIQKIDANLDSEVLSMRKMIENTKPPEVGVQYPELAYKPKRRTPKYIKERNKVRKIYMPEIHEQWLHHIIVLVLEPIIMATSYPYSCGSFPRRGGHYGKRKIERWIKSGVGIRNFLKIDIRHFYDSIRLEILMRELAIRIKDDWFLYIIRLCFKGFKRGIPLGFYMSQWLANYLLEPLDNLIVKQFGMKKYVRYMDDMVIFDTNKKTLKKVLIEIKKFLGQRFRLKIKKTWQICKFHYEKRKKVIGRPLDFMGFLFYRNRTIIRKKTMLSATRLAKKIHNAKNQNRGIYKKHISGMLSYIGWFTCTDTYDCYLKYIKPLISVRKLKHIISKITRKENEHEAMARREMC